MIAVELAVQVVDRRELEEHAEQLGAGLEQRRLAIDELAVLVLLRGARNDAEVQVLLHHVLHALLHLSDAGLQREHFELGAPDDRRALGLDCVGSNDLVALLPRDLVLALLVARHRCLAARG